LTINRAGYVELGLAYANVCRTLEQKINDGKAARCSQSALGAIERLTTWVEIWM
jgi:hypothetical protein